jgi:uncharacterized protein YdiU (UPF0061 family)
MTDATSPHPATDALGWRFENTYARLPAALFDRAAAAAFPAPRVAVLNRALAAELGLDVAALTDDIAAALFSGQRTPPGAEPIAQAYAGHQFGRFTMLGDGRALLLGEQRTPDGRLVDVQFKGSGPTKFSRRGDGRAALGPMLREYVVSEAMRALGIPTTRSLAVVTTGETVWRDDAKRGAVLTRVAASHLRVGTFQYAATLRDEPTLRALADYAIARHDPDLVGLPDRHLRFLRAVCERQAALLAQWQAVGFVHGVMNTDNAAVSGESIDFGPCAFMDAYDPDTVFSSIDAGGRYRYAHQPAIAQWNLARFAEALLPLFDPVADRAVELATAAIEEFPARFEAHRLAAFRRKLGLTTAEPEDVALLDDLLTWMHDAGADFTNTFRDLPEEPAPERTSATDRAYVAWRARWLLRVDREPTGRAAAFAVQRASNPAVIPRNLRVEEALESAERRDDLGPFRELVRVLATPFDLAPADRRYREPPPTGCGDYRTFCGT